MVLDFFCAVHGNTEQCEPNLYITRRMMMDKSNFIFKESPYGSGAYMAEINGFNIEIPETCFSDEKVSFVNKLIAAYYEKLPDIAQFCAKSECFEECYPEETAETIMEKLNLPSISIDNDGGILTYCDHELDSDHLIDVEFSGLMDSFFSVNIDG